MRCVVCVEFNDRLCQVIVQRYLVLFVFFVTRFVFHFFSLLRCDELDSFPVRWHSTPSLLPKVRGPGFKRRTRPYISNEWLSQIVDKAYGRLLHLLLLFFFLLFGISYMISRLIRLNMYVFGAFRPYVCQLRITCMKLETKHRVLKAVVVFVVVIVVRPTQVKRFAIQNSVDLCAHFAWKKQIFISTSHTLRWVHTRRPMCVCACACESATACPVSTRRPNGLYL